MVSVPAAPFSCSFAHMAGIDKVGMSVVFPAVPAADLLGLELLFLRE